MPWAFPPLRLPVSLGNPEVIAESRATQLIPSSVCRSGDLGAAEGRLLLRTWGPWPGPAVGVQTRRSPGAAGERQVASEPGAAQRIGRWSRSGPALLWAPQSPFIKSRVPGRPPGPVLQPPEPTPARLHQLQLLGGQATCRGLARATCSPGCVPASGALTLLSAPRGGQELTASSCPGPELPREPRAPK